MNCLSFKIKFTQFLFILFFFLVSFLAHAGNQPKFSLIPTTPTAISMFPEEQATVQYQVTNNTKLLRTLTIVPIQGVTIDASVGHCSNPFILPAKGSCLLTLQVTGREIQSPIVGGPVVCQVMGPGDNRPSPFLCSQPSYLDSLNISINTTGQLLSISVLPSNPAIDKTSSQQFTAIGNYSGGITKDLTTLVIWTSSIPSVANISNASGSQGLAVPVAPGPGGGVTEISAELNGIVGNTNLSVNPLPLISIAVTPADQQNVAAGITIPYTAIGTYADGETADITTQVAWASSAPLAATIDPSTGVASTHFTGGTTTISATFTPTIGPPIVGSTTLSVTPSTLASIAVTPADLQNVAAGITIQYTATGTYADGETSDITAQVAWDSSVPLAATIVSSTGLASTHFTGGTTTISATFTPATGPLVVGDTTLSVTPSPLTSITVTPANQQNVAAGITIPYTATGTYADGETADITNQVAWASSATLAATIDPSTGVASTHFTGGTTTISATFTPATGPLVVGDTTLSVTPSPLTSIAVTPADQQNVAAGITIQYTATGTYADGETSDITTQVAWASSATLAATIDPSTGVASTHFTGGTTTISATFTPTTGPLVVGDTTLSVTPSPLTSIAVTPANQQNVAAGITISYTATGTYADGETADITTQVAWASSATLAATIDPSTGVASTHFTGGTTTISATFTPTTGPLVVGDTTLSVTPSPLTSIAVTPANQQNVAAGITIPYTATGTYADGETADITTQVAWASSATLAATIDPSTGVASTHFTGGTTTISATFTPATGPLVVGDTMLNVTPATLLSVAVTPANTTIAAGQTQTYTAKATYSDGEIPDVTAQSTWTSSNTAAATMASNVATGTHAGGSTTIQALYNSMPGSTGLTVTPASLTSISVTPTAASINSSITTPANTQQYTAIGTYSDNVQTNITNSVNWNSSNTNIAGISSGGLATSLSNVGTTNITSSLSGVPSNTAILTVQAVVSGGITNNTATSLAGVTLLNSVSGEQLVLTAGQTVFSFLQGVPPGGSYNVTVSNQVSGLQCSVTNGSGQNVTANITNILVTCSATSFTIGGTISGLTASGLVLQNNGADNLNVASGSTTFTFSQTVAANSSYNVTVLTQPSGQTCTINGTTGTGYNVTSNITSVSITCNTNAYSVGGTITGLNTTGLVLQNNLTDNLTVAANATSFTFPTNIATGSTYSVTVKSQPPSLQCSVANATGTMGSAPVTNVAVTCVTVLGYVVNSGNNTLGVSVINTSNGSLGAPTPYSNAALSNPRSIAIEPTGTWAYIANNTGTVAQCTISSTGFSSCTTTGNVNFGLAVGIAFDPSSTHCYVSNSSITSIYVCNRSLVNGALTGCVNTGSGFNSPAGIAVHPTGNFAYVTNSGSNTVSLCKIPDKSTGLFTNCSSILTLTNLRRATTNPAGTLLYISQSSNNLIWYCPINVNTGALGTCTSTGTNVNVPLGVVIDPSGNYFYTANVGPASPVGTTATSCAINQATGALSNCIATSGFNAPTGIALTGRSS